MSGDSMLVRQWTIAARFYEPSDYDVPAPPTFRAERGDDGTVVLYDCDGREVLRASNARIVRR
jgi:hypothetical protein